jgi:hypothetical protein
MIAFFEIERTGKEEAVAYFHSIFLRETRKATSVWIDGVPVYNHNKYR